MGTAILAGGLAFVGGVEATELIVDGSFETTTPSSNPLVKIGGKANPGVGEGWGFFSTYLYSTLYTMPGPANSGLQYLRPYPAGLYGITQSRTNVAQTVSLTPALTPAAIDGGNGRYALSSWFCGYLTQGDYGTVTLEFLNTSSNVVGTATTIGGQDFVANLPTEANAKYPNAKDWGQDSASGTVPASARMARVTVIGNVVNGPGVDGYVDLVSLDVTDAGATAPVVSNANPPDNALGVGPVVNISVTIQDRTTAVNTNSIQLSLDGVPVSPPPSISQVDTNTIVQYAAGLLPALSPHTYRIVFSDNGTPVTTQTNQFHFAVADYLTLPKSLGSPLGSEDISKPGFSVSVYQVESLSSLDPVPQQPNIPDSVEFSDSVLAGLVGANVADLSGASSGNTFAVTGFIDWVNSTGVTANFPNDQPFPGIPGTSGSEDSFVNDIRTYVRFPIAGYYQVGVNNEDQFRLTAATVGYTTLQLMSPTNMVIPCVPIATNITQLQFGGALPLSPLVAPVVYGTPSGNPDDACNVSTNTGFAGKIVLLDRGSTNVTDCTSASIAKQAQLAGAAAVLEITPGDAGFPFRLDDIDPTVQIPVAVIAENYGGGKLKSYLTNGTPVTAMIRGDAQPRIAEWNGPKGFGAVDVLSGFAVPTAGIYPLRLVAGHSGPPGNESADLEFFSIQSDGTRILINDTSNPNALLAFRARTAGATPSMNAPTVSGNGVTISWAGVGLLEEASSVTGVWGPSPNQNNPQTIPAAAGLKFYRVRQL